MKSRLFSTVILLFVLALASTSRGQTISGHAIIGQGNAGSDKNSAAAARVYAPIRHQPYYRGERELFGYNPEFSPGTVSFDSGNLPYIIPPDNRPLVQTLDADGNWIELDFGEAIRQKFPEWNGELNTGPFGQARIYFAQDGDAYLLAATGRSNIGRNVLLHSRDQCRSWVVYPLPFEDFPVPFGEYARLEVNDTFNVTRHPPAITFYHMPGRGSEMWLLTPEKNEDGTLSLPEPILVTAKSATVEPHSGDGNFTVSIGDNIHIIWLSGEVDGKIGARHFAATYDRRTGTMSEPVFVGRSNEFGDPPKGANSHNLPVITVDGDGYLHAILGTHHHPFTYVRSLQPDSTRTWSKGELIGTPKVRSGKNMEEARGEGSYTYPSINCDPDGNIHVIARWAGASYYFRLVHLERSAAENRWLPQNELVVPFRAFYAVWYHKASIDRDGNLLVYYINYQNQLDEASLAEYNRRWPEDGAEDNVDPPERRTNRWIRNIRAKNPAILMRRRGEKRWYLATTSDFIANRRTGQ